MRIKSWIKQTRGSEGWVAAQLIFQGGSFMDNQGPCCRYKRIFKFILLGSLLSSTVLIFPIQKSFAPDETVYTAIKFNYDNVVTITYDCKKVADAAQASGVYFDPSMGYVCTPTNQFCKPGDPTACGGMPTDLCLGFKVCVPPSGDYAPTAAAPENQGVCVQVSATDCTNYSGKPEMQPYKDCNTFQCKTTSLIYTFKDGTSVSVKAPWCVTDPKDEHTKCEDGDACTTSECGPAKTIDHISSNIKIDPPWKYSECVSSPDSKACNEEIECKIGKCDDSKKSGNPCSTEDAPDGSTCEGANHCKAYACESGSCMEKAALALGACQACDPATGKIYQKPGCTACTGDDKCGDGQDCTDDKCVNGVCQNNPKPDNTVLDDNLDKCFEKICLHGKVNTLEKPMPVDAPPACNKWACKKNSTTSKWEYVPNPVSDGPSSSCVSDQFCQPKECKAGTCVNADPTCPDKSASDCVETTCDEAKGVCVDKDKAGCCNSDAECGIPGGASKECAVATCDMATKTCKVDYKNTATSCTVGAGTDKCIVGACDGSGSCASKTKVCAPDINPCTKDFCDSALGCVHLVNVGGSCDDGDACTVDDVCDGSGVCKPGKPFECAPPNDACLNSATCEIKNGGPHCKYDVKGGCCKVDLDCGVSTDCVKVTCDMSGGTGVCNYNNLNDVACALGKDCGECNFGACVHKEAPPAEACKSYACEGGAIQTIPAPAGTSCSGSDTCKEYACDKLGACVEKLGASKPVCNPPKNDCPGGNCNPPPGGSTPGGGEVKKGVEPPKVDLPKDQTATQWFLQGSGCGSQMQVSGGIPFDATWLWTGILVILPVVIRRKK